MVLILKNEDVQQIYDIRSCIGDLENAYIEMGKGRAINQRRIDTQAPLRKDERGSWEYRIKTMAAIIPKLGIAALRMNSTVHLHQLVNGFERDTSIPVAPGGRYVGLVLLFDIQTAEPLAIMQDGYIRNLRVAGSCAVAGKYLARSDSQAVGMIGSGWMARAHAEAFSAIRNINTIKVYSPNKEHRSAYASEISKKLGIDVKAVDEPADAIHNTDIALACTDANEPVLMGKWVEKGSYGSEINSYQVDGEFFERADVVVLHSKEPQEVHLMGGGQSGTMSVGEAETNYGWEKHVLSRIDPSKTPLLEDVILGRAKGRTDANQITIFLNNPGMGLQFAAASAAVYELAKKEGLGYEIPRELLTQSMRTG